MRGFFIAPQKNKYYKALSGVLVCVLSVSLVLMPSVAQAQSVLNLPVPGTMIAPSPAFVPVLLKGMTVHPEDPFQFDFIIDSGNTKFTPDQVKQESERLVKYFLASMTVPKDDLWVNLSPYENDRIIPEELGKTELGRDMLAQDYILKQLTASLMYPEKELGKKFWDKVYKKAEEQFGTTEIPVNTFNKVWILPDAATVYEHQNTVYIVDAHLKVMLDSDYEAMRFENGRSKGEDRSSNLDLQSSVIKEIIIPEIEREVNQGEHFAPLRQIYHSLILAKWYKETVKNSLLNQFYADKNKIGGINVDDETIKDQVYAQYMEAYKKGVFNYIKEDYDRLSNETIPRKYFSGGLRIGAGEINHSSSPMIIGNGIEGEGYKARVTMGMQKEGMASSPITIPFSEGWYINKLDHPNPDVQIKVSRKLGKKRSLRAINLLTEELKNGEPKKIVFIKRLLKELRFSALETYAFKEDKLALNNLGVVKTQIYDAYIRALSSPNEDVRMRAIYELGDSDYEVAIKPLQKLLSETDEIIGQEIIWDYSSWEGPQDFGERSNVYNHEYSEIEEAISKISARIKNKKAFNTPNQSISQSKDNESAQSSSPVSILDGASRFISNIKFARWILRKYGIRNTENPENEQIIRAIEVLANSKEKNEEDVERLIFVMHSAAYLGNVDLVSTLLKNGVDANSKDRLGGVALLNAALKGRNDVVKLLLDNGAEVNYYSPGIQMTALMVAARGGHTKTVKTLLRKGPNVNSVNKLGETALDLTKLKTKNPSINYQDIVEMLLKAGGRYGKASSPVISDEKVGGIDMNQIDVDRQGSGVSIEFDPVDVQEIMNMDFDGLAPVIINFTPLTSMLPLLGLAPQKEEEEFEVSKLISE